MYYDKICLEKYLRPTIVRVARRMRLKSKCFSDSLLRYSSAMFVFITNTALVSTHKHRHH